MTADPLAPVYTWLVDVLGFPFDMCTAEKPPWLDVPALAAAWAEHDARKNSAHPDTAEDWELSIWGETGWPDAACHDETCCMNGVAPASGPHPDRPGAGGAS